MNLVKTMNSESECKNNEECKLWKVKVELRKVKVKTMKSISENISRGEQICEIDNFILGK